MSPGIIPGIRPDDSTRNNVASDTYCPTEVNCTVEMVEPTGPDTMVLVWFNKTRATCRTHPRAGAVPRGVITLAFDLSKAVLFDPVSEQRIA